MKTKSTPSVLSVGEREDYVDALTEIDRLRTALKCIAKNGGSHLAATAAAMTKSKFTFVDVWEAVDPAEPIAKWSAPHRSQITRRVNARKVNVVELLHLMELNPDEFRDQHDEIATFLNLPE